VSEFPVNVGASTVPAGVILSAPPVVPILPLLESVPTRVSPLSVVSSLKPTGQDPDLINIIVPAGGTQGVMLGRKEVDCKAHKAATANTPADALFIDTTLDL
jgi:hypothetical protein